MNNPPWGSTYCKGLRVVYQCVAGQCEGIHKVLEWCKKRRIDTVFVGEA